MGGASTRDHVDCSSKLTKSVTFVFIRNIGRTRNYSYQAIIIGIISIIRFQLLVCSKTIEQLWIFISRLMQNRLQLNVSYQLMETIELNPRHQMKKKHQDLNPNKRVHALRSQVPEYSASVNKANTSLLLYTQAQVSQHI